MLPKITGAFGVEARLLGPGQLAELGGEWDRLSASALEENALYSRAYVMAGLRHLGERPDVRALCVFRRDPVGAERLIGLVPLRRSRFRYALPADIEHAAQNAFQTSGTPLLDREDAAAALGGILAAAGELPGLAASFLLPNIRRDDAFAQLLRQQAPRHGFDTDLIGLTRRPVLVRRPEGADAFFDRNVPAKRLRELRRSHRRLAEAGALTFRHVTEPAGLRSAVEDFLRIEASGWKGAQGSALLCRPDTAAFAREAFNGTSLGAPLASADVLALDGTAIAVSINLQVGRRSFTLKCAYDEAYRRFSPGLVLEYLVIECLFATRFADELDSCVTQDGHVIQDLWADSVEVGTVALRRRGARIGYGPLAIDFAEAEQRRVWLRARAKENYRAARDMLDTARALAAPGRASAEAKALRERLDARTRKAMVTLNTAQPNGELAAMIASIV